jgi:hypothetical protein
LLGDRRRELPPQTESHGLHHHLRRPHPSSPPQTAITVTITREERDAINDANAAINCAAYDGELFADMFAA